jgi:methylenetetrahydrofolate dehydrogenase (NADP+) / methenyltetrahydrofolate cyclohydrolase
MIIDGKGIAAEILATLRKRRAAYAGPIRLGIVVASTDPVIESFVKIKSKVAHELGIEIVRRDVTEYTTEPAMMAVRELSRETDGIIVQLPLPESIDANAVLSEIPVFKDVDGISTLSGEHGRPVKAPVALAVMEILSRAGIDPKGKRAAVVGAGRLVGVPTASLLKDLGADVTQITLDSGRIEDIADADIVVSGAGVPGLIRPQHIKRGVALIDAGTSEISGVITGDVDPACRELASVFTPVPGGVGPIAVTMIFKNILDLVERPR